MSSQYNSPKNKYLDTTNENQANALVSILQCKTGLEKNLGIAAICGVLLTTLQPSFTSAVITAWPSVNLT